MRTMARRRNRRVAWLIREVAANVCLTMLALSITVLVIVGCDRLLNGCR